MKNRNYIPIVISAVMCTILWLATPVYAQENRNRLEKEKIRLEEEIGYTASLLDETQDEKQTTLNELTLLSTKIEKRKKLIANYEKELHLVQDTLFEKLIGINRLSENLERLKAEYGRMIYHAYQNRNLYQRLMFVLAAENFNQAYNRMNYYRFYAEKRQEQAGLLKEAEQEYMAWAGLLEQKAMKTQELLNNLEQETALLEQEKKLKDQSIQILASRENELIDNQKQLQEHARKLKEKIEHIITETMTNSGDGNYSTLSTLTPEEETLSKDFSANRGKLPWPSERGVISSQFGEHDHPEIRNIKIKNNGINIMTHRNSKARAIFDGEVTRVMTVPNFNHVVIIRHGEYLTVYSNLREVFVQSGSKVNSKQEIGTIYTDENDSRTELHFEIWKGKGLLDPMAWLARENSSGLLRIDTP
ncbi:MAG: murein hydrolase activator EnvC family protein [Bacteroidales bacterium]